MNNQRPRGRAVPMSGNRLLAAQEIAAAHGAEMEEAAKALPRSLQLADGRQLKYEKHMSGGCAYRCRDGLVVIATYDPSPHGTLLHVSVSYPDRDPRWRDLRLLRSAFFPPDVDVIQVLPREGEYVNVHQHCFHLFQAPATWEGGWNV